MVLKVLGSSSKGNGYILDSGSEALILECGVNRKPWASMSKRLLDAV